MKSEIKQPEQREGERKGVKRATIFTVHCFLITGDGSVRLYVQKAFLIRGGHGMRLIDGIIFNLEKHAMTDKKHKTEVRFLEGLKGVEHVRSGGNRI